ncbi:MAG: proteasome accessory factor PafA2 family protein [Nitrososphaerales archaeon]
MDRVIGSETEYVTYDVETKSDRTYELIREIYSEYGIYGEFVANQGRVYMDVGNALECSTPETTNALDELKYEKAMERMVDDARMNYESKTGRMVGIFKDSLSPIDTTRGYHENYMVSTKVATTFLSFIHQWAKYIIPFLVSRIIFTGSGDYVPNRGGFLLSPRMEFTTYDLSLSTTSRRPLINLRHEPHSRKYWRLHLVCGDGNMAEISLALKFWATGKIVELIEKNSLPLFELTGSPPIQSIHYYGRSPATSWGLYLSRNYLKNPEIKLKLKDKNDKIVELKPVELQFIYLDAISSSALNDNLDYKMVSLLNSILKDLDAWQFNRLLRQLDWCIRMRVIKENIKNHGYDESLAIATSKHYSEIGIPTGRSYYYAEQYEGRVDRLVSDKDIEDAMFNPPKNTRASLRAKLCELYKDRLYLVDWGYVLTRDNKYLLELFDTDLYAL